MGKQGIDLRRLVKRRAIERFLCEARPKTEGRGKLDGFGRANPLDSGEFFDAGARQSSKRSIRLKQTASNVDSVRPFDPGSQQDGNQFAVGKRLGAMIGEFFPRPFLRGEFVNRERHGFPYKRLGCRGFSMVRGCARLLPSYKNFAAAHGVPLRAAEALKRRRWRGLDRGGWLRE